MSALPRHMFLIAMILVACKEKAPAPAPTSGSAATPTPAAAPGSAATPTPAAAPAPAAPGSPKMFDGPTFMVASSLAGPETKQKEIDTEVGKTMMTMYIFTDPNDGNTAQMVETNPVAVKPSAVAKVLESSMEGMTEHLKAALDEKKTVTVGDTSMLDFTAHSSSAEGDSFLRGRVAHVNGTLYQVIAIGSGTKPSSSAEMFVGSFTLK